MTLRNPHGTNSPNAYGAPQNDTGEFDLTLAQFLRNFSEVEYGLVRASRNVHRCASSRDCRRVFRAGPTAYATLLQAPGDESAELEVVLAPGDYRGASLSSAIGRTQRATEVVVRGSDPYHPPLLDDVTLSVFGDRVRLEISSSVSESTICPCCPSPRASRSRSIGAPLFEHQVRRRPKAD